MRYRNIDLVSAEESLQKMAAKENSRKYLNSVGDRNGAKFACDGFRMAAILPEGVDDWNFTGVYFVDDDENSQKFELSNIFNNGRDQSNYHFEITKKQSEILFQNGFLAGKKFLHTWNFDKWKNEFRN